MTSTLIEIKTVEHFPSARIVSLQGDIDELSLQDLTKHIAEMTREEEIREVIVDLNNVTFMNSKGLSQLIVVYNMLSSQQKQLILAGANEFVTDLISMVGVMKMIPYFVTLEEAISSLSS